MLNFRWSTVVTLRAAPRLLGVTRFRGAFWIRVNVTHHRRCSVLLLGSIYNLRLMSEEQYSLLVLLVSLRFAFPHSRPRWPRRVFFENSYLSSAKYEYPVFRIRWPLDGSEKLLLARTPRVLISMFISGVNSAPWSICIKNSCPVSISARPHYSILFPKDIPSSSCNHW